MTTADVVATLASPLNAFKIINTGETIGAFTQDRDSAIRGVLGAKAHMIPVHLSIHARREQRGERRKLNFEVLDLPSLTPQALMVALYSSLLRIQREHGGDQLPPDRKHRPGRLSALAAGPVGAGEATHRLHR